MARIDPIRVMVSIPLAREIVIAALRKSYKLRGDSALSSTRIYAVCKRRRERRKNSVAGQADGHLLIRREAQGCACIGNSAHDQAAVIAPVKSDPRSAVPELILQMSRLVEFFVVIDAENPCAALPPRRNPESGDLR